MKNTAAFLIAISCLAASLAASSHAHAASTADAREVARINNCQPTGIDVYQQSLGADGQTIYRVDCDMPKTNNKDADGTAAPQANALLIGCDASLCAVIRPISGDKK